VQDAILGCTTTEIKEGRMDIDALITRADKLVTEGGTPEVAIAMALVAIAKMMRDDRKIKNQFNYEPISRTLPDLTTIPDYEVSS
jgi:hypothetical protein